MTYLTAYRKQSSKYGNDRGKLSSPEPYRPKTRPLGDNDNSPRPANDNDRPAPKPANDNAKPVSKPVQQSRVLTQRNASFGPKATKALARLPFKRLGLSLIRVNPYLSLALTALDLWDAYGRASGSYQTGDQMVDLSVGGWIEQTHCPGVGQPPTHVARYSVFASWPTTLCLTGQAFTPSAPIYDDILPGHGQLLFMRYTHMAPGNQPRYANSQYWWRPATNSSRLRPKIRTFRQVEPFIVPAPDLLPIKWPMPYPLPLPMSLVNNRLNEPLGSQRTNGDKNSPVTPRQPPRSRQKEKKIRAIPAVVAALQAIGHGTTEAIDLLDALHSALPKSAQAKANFHDGKWWNASPQAKAAAVYGNWHALDMNKAMTNIVVNHVTDAFVGRAMARVKNALNNTPIGRINFGPTGFAVGPF